MKRFAFTSYKLPAMAIIILLVTMLSRATANAAAPSSEGPLYYLGGPTDVHPLVYVDFWGSEWKTGFTTGGYTSRQAQTYITDFFAHLGGSPWASVLTQYCMGIPVPKHTPPTGFPTSCGPNGTHITNPTGVLAGVFVHDAAIPKGFKTSDVAKEALWAMNNAFGGYNPDATYLVFTPAGYIPQDNRGCGWHQPEWYKTISIPGVFNKQITAPYPVPGFKRLTFAYVPYAPALRFGICKDYHLNSPNNAYGNGYFDGLSMVAGHEYAEAVTDPAGIVSVRSTEGWVDPAGHEIGDICENLQAANPSSNRGHFGYITLGAHFYAMEALWSNADNACVLSYPSVSPSASITEYPLPTGTSRPYGITRGPDGALWFTAEGQMGRITTAGQVTMYPLPAAAGLRNPFGITSGPDGALWFTLSDKIGRMTTSGQGTVYDVPSAVPLGPNGTLNLTEITSGPDGALWFTDQGYYQIGRITTAGQVTMYPLPAAQGRPYGITSGPDGALWFTASDTAQVARIGRITTAGQVTMYPLGIADSSLRGITSGPDGALWFTASDTNQIGRITTAGSITMYADAGTSPWDITGGPDGALWFTANDQIGRITTAGQITGYPIQTVPTSNSSITSGPDGALWFTETAANQIGRDTVNG